MGVLDIDATNSCIPPSSPLSALFPPLPTTVRGEPCYLDGKVGKYNDRPLLLYGNGRCVIVRDFTSDSKNDEATGEENGDDKTSSRVKAFVYRGHTAQVTCAKFSPSGAYIASADIRGKLRVWSYDNEEHFCKLDFQGMTGPIRGISWDGDNKRICIVGQVSSTAISNGKDASSCTRIFYWDTGVSCGELGRHVRNRVSACDFRKSRPMRIVTSGTEDYTLNLNSGPPFSFTKKKQDGHERGAIHAVKYIADTDTVVSIGADRKVCYWDGKTLDLKRTEENVHDGSIFSCDWKNDGQEVMTCGADGFVKFLNEHGRGVFDSFNIVSKLTEVNGKKIPFGGMQLGCAYLNNNVPLSVGVNGKIAVINDQRNDAYFLEGHQTPIAAMAFDFETNSIYTGDSDGIICRWDADTGASSRLSNQIEPDLDLISKVHKGTITAMQFVSGKLLSCGWDDKIRISNENESYEEIKLMKQPNGMAKGTSLVVIVMVDGVGLFQDGEIIVPHIELSFVPTCAAVSSDDLTVCIGGDDKNIYVYSVLNNSLKLKQTITHHLKATMSLSFSPNGEFLSSADVRDICVWNTLDWSPIISKNRWCFHAQKISCLAWSPNSQILASASIDDNIYLWNLKRKMKRINYPFCHRGGITGLVWKDNGILLSSGHDSCVCEWNVAADIENEFKL